MDPLWLKLFLTFCVGGLWVTLTTIVAESLGPRLGGWVGGLPSTIVVTLFFAGLVESAQVASELTTTIPLVIGINSVFLLVYAILAPRGLAVGLGVSLLVWFFLSSLPVVFGLDNFVLSLVALLLVSSFSYYILEHKVDLPPQPKLSIHLEPIQLAARAVFSGLVTALAVALTKLGGPILGGVFAVFPAVYVSTLVITSRSHGIDFSRALTKTLLPSGVLTVLIYSIAARYLFPIWGIFLGTLGAYLVSIASAYLFYGLVEKRL